MRSARCRRAALVAVLAALAIPDTRAVAAVRLTEISSEVGIEFTYDPLGIVLSSGDDFPNHLAPGVSWVDVNQDGWIDLVIGNGRTGNRLHLNNGDGTFVDVSGYFGFGESSVPSGIIGADLNNNGRVDLVMTNYLSDPELYRGGGGAFREVSRRTGINPLFAQEPFPGFEGPFSTGLALGDTNEDGFLDLYVANYHQMKDVLFHGDGPRYLRTDLVELEGVEAGMQPLFWDFDDDTDVDIFVVNDFGVDYLFRNDGPDSGWSFTEIARVAKVAGGDDKFQPLSMGMGGTIGDFDQDLDLDIYVTNFRANALWSNEGPTGQNSTWLFRNRAPELGIDYSWNCWGTDFFDADNDGDLDLVAVAGWVFPSPDPQPLKLSNKLWLNDGAPNFTFTDISESAGFVDDQIGRGLATADFDRDGDLDIVVTNNTVHHDPPLDGVSVTEGHLLFYRNDQDEGNNWITLRLVGGGSHGEDRGCNLEAIGAHLYLTAGGVTQLREIRAGSSFLSQNSIEEEIGLGDAAEISELRVRWPCGAMEVFEDATPNGFFRLVEGTGSAVPWDPAITSLRAQSAVAGVELRWIAGPGTDPASGIVERAPMDASLEFEELAIVPEVDGQVAAALDTTAVEGEEYVYRVVLSDEEGTVYSAPVFALAAFDEPPGDEPPVTRSVLLQNFPNPLNPGTTIVYEISTAGRVRLTIHDLRGRVVRTLVDADVEVGSHPVPWDGTDDAGRRVASGVYSYSLQAPGASFARKLAVVR